MEWILDHITKENGKWFAELKDKDITAREHSGNVWGWEGMSLTSLRIMIKKYYNVEIPALKDMKLIKKTLAREIYIPM